MPGQGSRPGSSLRLSGSRQSKRAHRAGAFMAVLTTYPAGTKPRPRIVAIIPALNEAPSIGRVVTGLLARADVELDRVIVVDNGSTDDTGDRARVAGASVVREE